MLSKMAYFGAFFCGLPYFLCISLNFLPWLESSYNEDSNATFPKLLGDTSKDTDFLDGRGREARSIADSLS